MMHCRRIFSPESSMTASCLSEVVHLSLGIEDFWTFQSKHFVAGSQCGHRRLRDSSGMLTIAFGRLLGGGGG